MPEFGTRTKIEVLVADSQVKSLVDDLIKNISTGSSSDGKIFVYDVIQAFDIRTKRSGDSAI